MSSTPRKLAIDTEKTNLQRAISDLIALLQVKLPETLEVLADRLHPIVGDEGAEGHLQGHQGWASLGHGAKGLVGEVGAAAQIQVPQGRHPPGSPRQVLDSRIREDRAEVEAEHLEGEEVGDHLHRIVTDLGAGGEIELLKVRAARNQLPEALGSDIPVVGDVQLLEIDAVGPDAGQHDPVDGAQAREVELLEAGAGSRDGPHSGGGDLPAADQGEDREVPAVLGDRPQGVVVQILASPDIRGLQETASSSEDGLQMSSLDGFTVL